MSWINKAAALFRSKSVTPNVSQYDLANIGDLMRYIVQYGITSNVSSRDVRGIPAYLYCRDLIATLTTSNPMSVHRRTAEGSEAAIDHPMYHLIKERPNPFMSRQEFWKTAIGHRVDEGNLYVHISERDARGYATRFDLWHPDHVEVKMIGTRVVYKNHELKIVSDYMDMIHVRDIVTSRDMLKGESRISIAREAFKEAIISRKMFNTVMEKGTFLSGYLKFPGKMNSAQLKEALEKFNEDYSGYDNLGATGAFEAGGDYVQLKVPFKDLQFLEQRSLGVYDVALILGFTPDQIGGVGGDGSSSSFNSLEQHNMQKMQYPIIPTSRALAQEINYKAFPMRAYGSEFVHIDFKGMLEGNIRDRTEYYKTMLTQGVYTHNDIRKLEDLNTVADGERRYMQMSFAPIDVINQMSAANLPNNGATTGEKMKFGVDSKALKGILENQKKAKSNGVH